ncbi:sensor histidine kinase [Lewinella sp. 4G2]|uniref:sensor histidine kinase n=1 Tax=Lewinella sp. 4G2 TaxID=1803372 RepID=UPI0007B4CE74|nr:sensor histidine kinase [Lewinella sp. 4G2]OAV43998.1 hypothetical protein A3850_005590 [Lewinella sp. 4G2]
MRNRPVLSYSLLLLALFLGTCASAQTEDKRADLSLLGKRLSKEVPGSDAAAAVLDTIRQVSEELGTDFSKAYYLEQRVIANQHKMDTAEMRQILEEALALYEKDADDSGRARVYGRLGYVGFRSRNYLMVYEMAAEQLKAAKLAKDDQQIGTALGNLGLSSKLIGNKPQARRYYLESIEHAKRTSDTISMVKSYHNLGNLHPGKDPAQIDSSLMYGKLATDLLLVFNPNDHDMLARRYGADGRAYIRRGDLVRGREMIERSLEMYRKAGDPLYVFGETHYLGRVNRKLGNLKEAGRLLFDAAEQLKSVPRADPSYLYSELGLYYREIEQADSTAKYMGMYADAIRDQSKDKQAAKIASLETKFRTQEQRAEIERLALEDELNEVRITRQRQWLVLAGLAVILISLLAYRLLRQRKRIAAQNDQISLALGQKEMLIREIHHRVKNNLQLVSSLLSLQSRYLEDEGAVAALKMGNSRVRSMALIHQRLYLEDEVNTRVNAKDYFEKLADELVGNLSGPGRDLSLSVRVENLDLDIDTIIPLGLIANELLTNALKYAWAEGQPGHLVLALSQVPGEDQLRLIVEDDGVGIKGDPVENPSSFGYLLISSLVGQLEGKIEVNSEGGGTSVVVTAPRAV